MLIKLAIKMLLGYLPHRPSVYEVKYEKGKYELLR